MEKKIAILFEFILLLPFSKTTSSDQCCFLSKLPASFCKAYCANNNDKLSLLPLPTSSFAPVSPYLPLLPTMNEHSYQTNSLLRPIPPVYPIQQLPFHLSNSYPSPQQLLYESDQSYVPVISQVIPEQQRIQLSQEQHALLPSVSVHSFSDGSSKRIQQLSVPIKKMAQSKKKSRFGSNTSISRLKFVDKTRNMNDKEVADLLDAIEEFRNQTLQIHESTKPVPISSLVITDDSECNSNVLKTILFENIGKDLNATKRLIQIVAESQFGGHFNVICSKNDFSFLTNTELFCQATKGDVSCYAYRLLS
uniref:Ground-like domain-containing protein n=1 Tax=Setaria digitata TaxID=48799 RepID=A0A915Q5T6_9BILA